MRQLIVCLLVVTGCAVDSSTTAAPDAAVPPPELSASLLISWGGQNVTSTNPSDSRVPRTLTGPVTPCPNVVGNDVKQVDIEVIVGTESAYVTDVIVDCALGHMTIPVPAGSGMFRLDVFTAWGYSWLASYTPITTVSGQTTEETSNLNNEIPTTGTGGDGDGGGLGGYL